MAHVKTERHTWIEAGLSALAKGGPDSVRIESLARALGVTKGGFYGYFVNRQALLEAMLDSWESDCTQAVVDQVEQETLSAGASAFRAAQLTWAAGGLLEIDLAIREWSRRDAAVASRLADVDRFRLDYLRRKMHELCTDPREAEARTLLAYLTAIGMHYAGISMVDLGQQRRDVMELLTTSGTFHPPWQTKHS